MVNTLKLPVGIDSFEKIRRNGFYYIDKTNLIEHSDELGGSNTVHPSATFWQDVEYEHAEKFF